MDYSLEALEIFNRVYDLDINDGLSSEKALELYNKIQEEGLHPDIEAQLKIEEDERQRKIESGEIVLETFESALRKKGMSEEEIKAALEYTDEEYIGVQ